MLGKPIVGHARRATCSRDPPSQRALADPRLLSEIGNAYSDKIQHAARLSPLALTKRLTGGHIVIGECNCYPAPSEESVNPA